MKALAIDSAVSCITLAAKNEEKMVSLSLDIGMHQSERLLPSIDYVMKEAGVDNGELNYIAISSGPGSFTGLRLGFAAAKALHMATGCPIYGIPTLDAYAWPYKSWPGYVIAAIDAKKERFFARMYRDGIAQTEAVDTTPESIASWLSTDIDTPVLLVGPDAAQLQDVLVETGLKRNLHRFTSTTCPVVEALLAMGNELIQSGATQMEDHAGPVYLRQSEAEEKAAINATK